MGVSDTWLHTYFRTTKLFFSSSKNHCINVLFFEDKFQCLVFYGQSMKIKKEPILEKKVIFFRGKEEFEIMELFQQKLIGGSNNLGLDHFQTLLAILSPLVAILDLAGAGVF